jgi:hypothetical protein
MKAVRNATQDVHRGPLPRPKLTCNLSDELLILASIARSFPGFANAFIAMTAAMVYRSYLCVKNDFLPLCIFLKLPLNGKGI